MRVVAMRRNVFLPIFMLFAFIACSPQETGDDSGFYIQIEDTRFYLRHSHRDDVEAFLGSPSSVYFFERGGDGFYWTDFALAAYEEGYLRIYYNSEGNIIRAVVSISYSRGFSVFGRPSNELNHVAVTQILEQANIRIFHNTENFIGSIGYDFEGNRIAFFFDFDDESNITWFEMYYEEPWDEESYVR